MHCKYHDTRVYPHFARTYSKVLYLDSEIFNVQTDCLLLSRKANNRVANALQALQTTTERSERLSRSLRQSRVLREQENQRFINDLKQTQEAGLERSRLFWSSYCKERQDASSRRLKDQAYLDSILKTTSTKAQSRLTSVRRWE